MSYYFGTDRLQKCHGEKLVCALCSGNWNILVISVLEKHCDEQAWDINSSTWCSCWAVHTVTIWKITFHPITAVKRKLWCNVPQQGMYTVSSDLNSPVLVSENWENQYTYTDSEHKTGDAFPHENVSVIVLHCKTRHVWLITGRGVCWASRSELWNEILWLSHEVRLNMKAWILKLKCVSIGPKMHCPQWEKKEWTKVNKKTSVGQSWFHVLGELFWGVIRFGESLVKHDWAEKTLIPKLCSFHWWEI